MMGQKVPRDRREGLECSLPGEQGNNRSTTTEGLGAGVNPSWRVRVTQWCYDYVDCISERRTIVYIAMNILDRYCRTLLRAEPEPDAIEMEQKQHQEAATIRLDDQSHYQVAALASTYLAIRIAGSSNHHHPKRGRDAGPIIQLSDLVAMSRGRIAEGDIIAMGTTIVKRLSWEERMETPTEWVYRYLDQCRTSWSGDAARTAVTTTMLRRMAETANFMVEVATFDLALCDLTPRILAAAAVLRVLTQEQRPALAAILRNEDYNLQAVSNASLRLGIFVKKSLLHHHTTSPSLAATYPTNVIAGERAAAPHVIEADDDEDDDDGDHILRMFQIQPKPCPQRRTNDRSPVFIRGVALIPNDDDDDDDNAMEES